MGVALAESIRLRHVQVGAGITRAGSGCVVRDYAGWLGVGMKSALQTSSPASPPSLQQHGRHRRHACAPCCRTPRCDAARHTGRPIFPLTRLVSVKAASARTPRLRRAARQGGSRRERLLSARKAARHAWGRRRGAPFIRPGLDGAGVVDAAHDAARQKQRAREAPGRRSGASSAIAGRSSSPVA